MTRLNEQEAKKIIFNAQVASYPSNDVPLLLKPLYGYVESVEAEVERLQAENATLKAERDAAVEDMNTIVSTATECLVCKNRVGASGCPIRYKKIDCFEWRGVKAKEESENG